jgi:hypothetical protein
MQVEQYYKRFGKEGNTICLREFVTAAASCVPDAQERMAEIQFEAVRCLLSSQPALLTPDMQFDANNDGKLTEEEYLKLIPVANPTKLAEGQMRSVGKELFHLLDSQNKGESA